MAMITESQGCIDALSSALLKIESITVEATSESESIISRSKHLNSLTSPASDASALLTQAQQNLVTTLSVLKEARAKFDTVTEYDAIIRKIFKGARDTLEFHRLEMENQKTRVESGGKDYLAGDNSKDKEDRGSSNDAKEETSVSFHLTEEDVFAAVEAMDAVKAAHVYFSKRTAWKSSPTALSGLEKLHQLGVDSMCRLITAHLTVCGPAVTPKRTKKNHANETAVVTRKRFNTALTNRDVLKSVGEYEEFLPLDPRSVRELRLVMECLSGDKSRLGPNVAYDKSSIKTLLISSNKVVRTEHCGSGSYTAMTKEPLKTGFPPLDAYGECRRNAALFALDYYHRRAKAELAKSGRITNVAVSESADIDAAARDAIRCLEHAMVVIAGEKSIYRCVISPSSSHTHDETKEISAEMRLGLLASYSHVTSTVVDRTIDIIETVFFKDAALAKFDQKASATDEGQLLPYQTVRATASAAAAGLRILDGVRLLGPSLTKLCELSDASHVKDGPDGGITLAGGLCIGIHRTTVKNTARALEILTHAIENDPVDGEKHRPADARVAALSSDVVRALRVISPFVAAYKSVTKRRSLPWDENIGEDTKDIDTYAKHILTKLLKNLMHKSIQYTKETIKSNKEKDVTGAAKQEANKGMFMVNNTYYLLEQLCTDDADDTHHNTNNESAEHYRIEKSTWLRVTLEASFQTEKKKYMEQWDSINNHLTSVPPSDIKFQKESLLTLESGRLFKSRFSGFIETFELNHSTHKNLTVADDKLREMLRNDIKSVFLPKYKKFYDKYSKLNFSKKNSDMYLKYSPPRVNSMIDNLYFVQ